MKQTGHADLPLHYGTVPRWLADRMMQLGTLIIESLVYNFGKQEVLLRLSDPLWFQSFGAVLGMDWHSSGITTSVMYALKRGINPRARELGLCVCGGRGIHSRKTPEELSFLAQAAGLDAVSLMRASRLCAKIDNTAIQDGFQLYQHNFILSDNGSWTIVQQGMNIQTKQARRYHWCSIDLRSFVENPHTGIVGENRGKILNLTAADAAKTRTAILGLSNENPAKIIPEIKKILSMPSHEEIRAEDVNLKRLGAVLAAAYEKKPESFENLMLTQGLGPRTLQSLTLISEIIYGTPSRFSDPARFSFAHGGKDGHPFPVPLKIYDRSIQILHKCIELSKLGYSDKSNCLRRLHETALHIEQKCAPSADFKATIMHEQKHSKKWGGRTVFSGK